jgi:AcrR family transcriptional regulator
MEPKQKSKPRLNRQDWLETALAALAEGGSNAVTVDALATRLGITRGSFYHHFKDRKDLATEMLTYWEKKWTTDILDDVKALHRDGKESLRVLAHLIQYRKAADYDPSVRAWALHDPDARQIVRQVDEIRLGFVRSMFQDIGFEGLDRENRARLYLFYAMSEPAFFYPLDEASAIELAEERLDFLTARQG